MRRLLGALFVAFLILAVAVTPLLATFRPASFDLVVGQPGPQGVLRATLEDQTGLVEGFNFDPDAQVSPGGIPTRSLVISWVGGCNSPDIYMRLIPSGDGYLIV